MDVDAPRFDVGAPRRARPIEEGVGVRASTWQSDATASDQADQDYDDRNHQKDVNKPAQRVRGDKPQDPQHDQNYCNNFEHLASPVLRNPGQPGTRSRTIDTSPLDVGWNCTHVRGGSSTTMRDSPCIPVARALRQAVPIRPTIARGRFVAIGARRLPA
jgi:hypothetical protein